MHPRISRSICFGLAFVLAAASVSSQALIATSRCPEATANHNQRKIVRDDGNNRYVVYSDSLEHVPIIRSVHYDGSAAGWEEPVMVAEGNAPTLTLLRYGKLCLVYCSNDEPSRILYRSSVDFSNWSEPLLLSDSTKDSRLPVADGDSLADLNVMWIESTGEGSETLKHARISQDTIDGLRTVVTKSIIQDLAIANNLSYETNQMIFGYQFNGDSILYFRQMGGEVDIDTIFGVTGSQPCVSYNFDWLDRVPFRLLYLDDDQHLVQVVIDEIGRELVVMEKTQGRTDYVSIDNIAPPFGYSYLYMMDGVLYHAFSKLWSTGIYNMDTISSDPVYPSIAYRNFRIDSVDFIWMEEAGDAFNIFHNRSEKIPTLIDPDPGAAAGGFSISGYPNPFMDVLHIELNTEGWVPDPKIRVYDMSVRLITVLTPHAENSRSFGFRWNGTDASGERVSPGVYILLVEAGKYTAARRIILTE